MRQCGWLKVFAATESTSSFGYIRSTPFFHLPSPQPALLLTTDFTRISIIRMIDLRSLKFVQMKHDMSYLHGAHSFKWGVEIRLNKDATIFGTNRMACTRLAEGRRIRPSHPSTTGYTIFCRASRCRNADGSLTATPFEYTITARQAQRHKEINSIKHRAAGAYSFYLLMSGK